MIKSYDNGLIFDNNLSANDLDAQVFVPKSLSHLNFMLKKIFDKQMFLSDLHLNFQIINLSFILVNVYLVQFYY